jgi:hypothetical protein
MQLTNSHCRIVVLEILQLAKIRFQQRVRRVPLKGDDVIFFLSLARAPEFLQPFF